MLASGPYNLTTSTISHVLIPFPSSSSLLLCFLLPNPPILAPNCRDDTKLLESSARVPPSLHSTGSPHLHKATGSSSPPPVLIAQTPAFSASTHNPRSLKFARIKPKPCARLPDFASSEFDFPCDNSLLDDPFLTPAVRTRIQPPKHVVVTR